MCLICVELAKSKMSSKEARQAFREMRDGMDRVHAGEVEAKIAEIERQDAARKP